MCRIAPWYKRENREQRRAGQPGRWLKPRSFKNVCTAFPLLQQKSVVGQRLLRKVCIRCGKQAGEEGGAPMGRRNKQSNNDW